MNRTPSSAAQPSLVASLLGRVLLATAGLHKISVFRALWHRALALQGRIPRNYRARLYGFPIVLNPGNIQPVAAKWFPYWNAPIAETVAATYRVRGGQPCTVLDVGAATGDTVLFLERFCGPMISDYLCVEGDPEFAVLLSDNVRPFGKVLIEHVLLSDREGSSIPALVRTHGSTASAQGRAMSVTTTLDSVVKRFGREIHVLKIDVDGFDGRVLGGAAWTLGKWKPSVIFEWHPGLLTLTRNPPFQSFEACIEAGYEEFLFFTKFGNFSHFMSANEKGSLEKLGSFAERSRFYTDWHYDVVALPPGFDWPFTDLADLTHYRSFGEAPFPLR